MKLKVVYLMFIHTLIITTFRDGQENLHTSALGCGLVVRTS